MSNMTDASNVWFPVHLDNGIATGLCTMSDREASQECSICYYDSANESEHDTDIEDKIQQETLHHTLRYAQMYQWSPDNLSLPAKAVCPHQFHTVCMYQWFEQSGKMLCPVCKQGINEKVQLPPLL